MRNRNGLWQLLIYAGLATLIIWFNNPDWGIVGALKLWLFIVLVLSLIALIFISIPIFQQLFPSELQKPSADLGELEALYNKWKGASSILSFLAVPIIGFSAYLGLALVANQWSTTIKAVYVVSVDSAYWGIPALFIGIAGAALLIPWVLRVFFGKQTKTLEQYYDYKSGLNSRKANVVLMAGIAVLCFGLILGGLDDYTRFTEEAIIVRHFYQLPEDIHYYEEVTQIRVIERSNKRDKTYSFVINFEDGDQWRMNTSQERLTELTEIMDFVAQKSHLDVERISIGTSD
jgi:hypothetical protein